MLTMFTAWPVNGPAAMERIYGLPFFNVNTVYIWDGETGALPKLAAPGGSAQALRRIRMISA